MTISTIQISIGLVLLYLGAEGLVRGSSSLAKRLQISPLVIGLTIVAFGTSMPELIVSIKTTLSGQGAISIGNVVGSNIFNIAGILGVASIISPIKAVEINTIDTLFMILFSVLLLPLLWTKFRLQRWEGFLLLTGYVLYVMLLLK